MSILRNAVSVLRVFDSVRRDLSVTDAARLLALPKSSASRLLGSMRDVGLLESSGRPPRYRIGTLLLEVASVRIGGARLNELADAALAEIIRQSGHTGYVSVLNDTDIVVVRVRPGTHSLQVVTPLGQRLAAFETAVGRSLLARLTDEEVRARYRPSLNGSSANSPQSLPELLARLAEVRRRGWAEALDEGVPGVGSTAVSICDEANNDMVGLCLSYPATTKAPERRHLANLLIHAARDIAIEVRDDFWTRSGIGAPPVQPAQPLLGRVRQK